MTASQPPTLSDSPPPAAPQPVLPRGFLLAAVLLLSAAGIALLLWALHDAPALAWPDAAPRVFGGLALLLVAALLWFLGHLPNRRHAQALDLRQQHPQEPWLWNSKWADGRIRDSGLASMFVAWLFAISFLGIGLPGAIGAVGEAHRKGIYLPYIALIFPLVGAGFLVWALTNTYRRLKFGASILELATFPGVIGGQLVGVIYTRHKLPPSDGYHLRLQCFHSVSTGSGKNRSTYLTTLWDDQATMIRGVMDDDASRTAIPVGFQIPADAAPSDDANPNDFIYWQLQARAKVPGLDYLATFVVPVYRAADTPQLTAPIDPVAAYRAPEPPQTAPTLPGISLHEIPGGIELRFRAARNLGLACLTTFMGVTFAAIGIGVGYYGGIACFGFIFLLVGIAILIAAARAWFLATRIAIAEGTVRLESRFLGFRRAREFPTADIAEVLCPWAGSFGQSALYRIQLKTTAGRTLTVATDIPSKKEADWLAAQLRAALSRSAR